LGVGLALSLVACAGVETQANYPQKEGNHPVPNPTGERETIFGPGGINFLESFGDNGSGDGSSGIGVNAFLWRASLDTLSFMPLNSADPFGGVIITDWHSPPETPGERFKMTIYILDRRLRADGLKVAVFRQEKSSTEWVDSAVTDATARQLENAILQRARQLRLDSLGE
jgi:hypothetical protein